MSSLSQRGIRENKQPFKVSQYYADAHVTGEYTSKDIRKEAVKQVRWSHCTFSHDDPKQASIEAPGDIDNTKWSPR